MAMILYAIWLIRAWQREIGDWPFEGSDYAAPWFIHTVLGLGVTLCVITCSGHVSAETANGYCLYFYMAFIFLLLMLEAAVTTYVLLGSDVSHIHEKLSNPLSVEFLHVTSREFPVDPSGGFNRFKDFVRSNFEFCKWIGLSIMSVQGLNMLFGYCLANDLKCL